MTTFYDYRARVLSCENCGAPLDVPTAGGQVGCSYCGAINVVNARPTAPVRDPREADVSEERRLAGLRAQGVTLRVPPAALRKLLRGTTIDDAGLPAVIALYQRTRAEQRVQPRDEHEKLLYSSTLVFSNYYGARQDHARVRAYVESSLEALKDPRYRQVLYGMMARLAVRQGELDAAESWAGFLDARSTDLMSDTAYRMTGASLATHRGAFPRVLELLGRHAGDVPISSENVAQCALLRCHAVEHLLGVEAAVAELVRSSRERLGIWLVIERSRRYHLGAGVTLCPQSFEPARAAVSVFRRSWLTVPCAVAAVFLLIMIPLGLDAAAHLRDGSSALGLAGPILFGVLGLLGVPQLLQIFRSWSPSKPGAADRAG